MSEATFLKKLIRVNRRLRFSTLLRHPDEGIGMPGTRLTSEIRALESAASPYLENGCLDPCLREEIEVGGGKTLNLMVRKRMVTK